MTFIWRENTYGYFSVDTICSEERIVWRERHSRKTVSPRETDIIRGSTISRQVEAILCIVLRTILFFSKRGIAAWNV